MGLIQISLHENKYIKKDAGGVVNICRNKDGSRVGGGTKIEKDLLLGSCGRAGGGTHHCIQSLICGWQR